MQADPHDSRPDPMASFPPDLRGLVERLEDGVVLAHQGRVTGANPALGRLLGIPPGDLAGRPTGELFCDSEGRPLASLAPSDGVRLRDARGDLVPVLLRELGPGMFLVADRSRESRLEGELWRLSLDLRRLAGERPSPRVLHGEAAAMIEHEMRTASTAVRGYLDLLLSERAGPVDAVQRGFLGEAVRAARQIEELLDRLLELATPGGAETLRVARKPARLGAIVREALGAARPLLEARGCVPELDLEEDADEILADERRLGQVVVNLLSNAAKFAPPGSTVRLATGLVELEGGDRLCLSVEDQGPGVGAEEAERIFEPFVRGRRAAEEGASGVGLGLAICRKVVEAHGGTIEAVPSLGHGLFRVLLPRDGGEAG